MLEAAGRSRPGAGRAGGALRLAGLACALVGAVFVARAMSDQWPQLAETVSRASWPWVAVAIGLFVAAELVFLLRWPATLRSLGCRVDRARSAATLALTQMSKFVPGAIWPAVARVGAAGAIDSVPARRASAGLAIEIGNLVGCGLVIAALTGAATGLVSDDPSGPTRWVVALLMSAAGVGIVLAARFVARRAGATPSPRDHLGLLGGHGAALAGWGAGTAALAAAIGAPGAAALGAFALAWVAGFVVIGAPAGLGVREAVMVAALAPSMGQADAVAVALGSRAVWTSVQVALAVAAAATLGRALLGGRGRAATVAAGGPA